jgi:hypothetical protein
MPAARAADKKVGIYIGPACPRPVLTGPNNEKTKDEGRGCVQVKARQSPACGIKEFGDCALFSFGPLFGSSKSQT